MNILIIQIKVINYKLTQIRRREIFFSCRFLSLLFFFHKNCFECRGSSLLIILKKENLQLKIFMGNFNGYKTSSNTGKKYNNQNNAENVNGKLQRHFMLISFLQHGVIVINILMTLRKKGRRGRRSKTRNEREKKI